MVTALFADLVGSTALAEQLDADEVRLIVGEAISRIVGIVETFGGTVKDLAGDGVLALFGAPVTHEDDAERALRASLRIVDEAAAYGSEVARAWGIEGLAIRVGVATGQVVLATVGGGRRVEYAAFGDTVNTAARLQSLADPGRVLASASTRQAIEPLFEWGDWQSLTLKGKTEPVSACVVISARAPGTPRGDARVQARLVGRDRELAAAKQIGDRVLEGSGAILFLTGDAGIGKTRLVAELRSHLENAPAAHGRAMWLEGRCVSYGEAMPYLPFRDMLRGWLGVAADEPELRVRVALRRRVERLFGERVAEIYPYLGAVLALALERDAAGRLAELSPEALQFRTFEVIREWLARLADDGPVIVALEDFHWADATSLRLADQLKALTENAAVLLLITARPERDHSSWSLKESATRELPHRATEIMLEALGGDSDRELLNALVGTDTMPDELQRRILEQAEGNPFFLEELIRSLVDAGALVRDGDGWRFDHAVEVAVPATVENVILARIDRLDPRCHDVLLSAAVLGRQFSLSWLEGVARADGDMPSTLQQLQRLDLLREGRRWPQPEYRFKHVLIQEAAYGTILAGERTRLHRRAAEWLEERYRDNSDEVAALLAHHWLACADEDKATAYLARAGDKARLEYALDEAVGHYRALLPLLERRGRERDVALVLFKLALALHMSLRFAEANSVYQQAFGHWTPPQTPAAAPTATLRVATSFLPDDPDPKTAIAWPNIQLCMQLFDRLVEAWPERALVPSLAERWEIADDGLRYVFHLRPGLTWSDGAPLTAADIEYGIKRVLDPSSPGSSVAIYFVLENGQDYYTGRNRDADRIGVRALDAQTIEFRLVAPAPYFMSLVNRPDAGPAPRHVIEGAGKAWVEPDRQVVCGPFRQVSHAADSMVLERNSEYAGVRLGNVRRVEFVRATADEGLAAYGRNEVDMITARYTPRLADQFPEGSPDAKLGAATWTGYIAFAHGHPDTAKVNLRRALAHAVDREALRALLPINMMVANGGLVPPALQGHTPDIAPRFDPELARQLLAQAAPVGPLTIAAPDAWEAIIDQLIRGWERELRVEVTPRTWSSAEALAVRRPWESAQIYITGWLPGYPDPEYYLRLLLHSQSRTNEGGFAHPPFDALIEEARHERSDRSRLALFHEADRVAVAEQVALIPLVYGRSMAIVKPWVNGWWEFGKSSSSFADLVVDPSHHAHDRPHDRG